MSATLYSLQKVRIELHQRSVGLEGLAQLVNFVSYYTVQYSTMNLYFYSGKACKLKKTCKLMTYARMPIEPTTWIRIQTFSYQHVKSDLPKL